MNLRKLFPFLNKKEGTLNDELIKISNELKEIIKEQEIKREESKADYYLDTPIDERIEHAVSSYIYRHNKAPNVIIANDHDLKDFKKVIENNINGFKLDLSGQLKYRGIDVIRSVYIEKGNVFASFIIPELI